MKNYLVRRLLLALFATLLFTIFLFGLLRILPGDTITARLGPDSGATLTEGQITELRKQYGIDKPVYKQYWSWLRRAVRGDLGLSLTNGISVAAVIKKDFPVTLELAALSLFIAYLFALPMGIFMAIKQDTAADYILRVVSITGLAIPTFGTGIFIIIILSRYFHWLPPVAYAQLWDDPFKNFQQMIWPALAIAFASMAFSTRIVRSSMLEVLRQDYIRTAQAKGLKRFTVFGRHALRNALIPIATLLGIQVSVAAAGTVIMERLFNLPGIGRALIDAISSRDFATVQGITLVIVVWVMVANLVVDAAYGWLDPRVRY